MPYNGSGTFNRVYSWVQDALNGLFISSTRMDTEMDGFATGLTNCLTRDGQSPPSANLPMNSFKLTGLANGTAATDSVNYGQISATAFIGTSGGWVLETAVAAFATATTFTVAGNLTARYTPGRRIRVGVTGPPTSYYGTVVSSVFGAVTTVTVLKDTYPVASANLDAGFANLQYGLYAADYAVTPWYTDTVHFLSVISPASATPAQFTPISGAAVHDTMSEISAAGNFTPKLAGRYIFSGVCTYQNANTYSSPIFGIGYKVNGGAFTTGQSGCAVNATVGVGFIFTPFMYTIALAANDVVSFWGMPGTYSAGSPSMTISPINIRRLA